MPLRLLHLHPQVLTFGIITAAVLRAVMILLGTELIQKFEPLLIGFAFILLYSAYGLLFNEEDDNDDLSDNAIVKFCRKVGAVDVCVELMGVVSYLPTMQQRAHSLAMGGCEVRFSNSSLHMSYASRQTKHAAAFDHIVCCAPVLHCRIPAVAARERSLRSTGRLHQRLCRLLLIDSLTHALCTSAAYRAAVSPSRLACSCCL